MKYRDTLGRFFTPGAIADIPTGNLLWVDAVNGNNALAARARMTVPFQTLQKARDAAVSGDTIMVMPGTYNENDLLRNGINWHFFNGTKINYTGGGSLAIFDTNGASVTSRITGYGEFINGNSSGSKQVIYFATGGPSVFVQAKRMQAEAECVRAIASSGLLELEVSEDIHATTEGLWMSGGCTVKVRAGAIYSSAAAALRMSAGRCEVDAHDLTSYSTSSQDGTIRVDGGTGLSSVRAVEILGGFRPGVLYNASSSSTKIHIIGARIVASGSTSNGRSVDIQTNVSDGVRLVGCALIASGDYSLFAANSGTRVHVLDGLAVNIAQNANVSAIGGEIYTPNSNIN